MSATIGSREYYEMIADAIKGERLLSSQKTPAVLNDADSLNRKLIRKYFLRIEEQKS